MGEGDKGRVLFGYLFRLHGARSELKGRATGAPRKGESRMQMLMGTYS